MKAQIELIIRVGQYGQKEHRIALALPPDLAQDLMEPVEVSDESWSILLASPALYGGHGNAVQIREQKFQLRRAMAKKIAGQIESELIRMFGHEDERDGYKARDWPGRGG